MQAKINKREAHITALYLAKFDQDAVIELGCKTWDEVYQKIGNILNYKPSAIKNSRDWFDPYFPNPRQGWYKNKPYKTVRDILEEFRNYEFKNLTEIVKNILGEDLSNNLDIYNNSTFIANLYELNNKQIEQEIERKNRERSLEEKRHVLALWEKEGGKTEVAIYDRQLKVLVGLADLITETEVIEVKDIKNWKYAVGQIFAYWYYLENNDKLVPRIHLFGGDGIDDSRIKLCESLMSNIFFPDFDKKVIVTYSEKSVIL